MHNAAVCVGERGQHHDTREGPRIQGRARGGAALGWGGPGVGQPWGGVALGWGGPGVGWPWGGAALGWGGPGVGRPWGGAALGWGRGSRVEVGVGLVRKGWSQTWCWVAEEDPGMMGQGQTSRSRLGGADSILRSGAEPWVGAARHNIEVRFCMLFEHVCHKLVRGLYFSRLLFSLYKCETGL